MFVKLLGAFCFVLCLMSCSPQPKYEYSIEVTSETVENSTIERLKQRLNSITSEVNITKKNDQKLFINFKSSAIDTIVKTIITTKGNLSFYETKNLKEMILVIEELSKVFSSDTTTTQNHFYEKMNPATFPESAELGYVHAKDTSVFNRLFISSEIKHYLSKEQLRVQFAWGLLDNQTSLIPLYALVVDTKNGPAMHGDIISDVSTGRTYTGNPSIYISMEGLQAEKWERLTRRASEDRSAVAIVIDDIVFMAPVVSQVIMGGSAEISGDLKEKEVFALSVILKSGPIEQLTIIDIDKQTL